MMRDRYGIYYSAYFTGQTGREIQACGLEACLLGLYLGINEHATMLGLYRLPMLYLEEELPVLASRTRIRRAFADLATLPSGAFAHYDEASGYVWVPTMVRIRLNLAAGARIKPSDNRHRAVVALYDSLGPNPFLGAFYDRHGAALELPRRRPGTTVLGAPIFSQRGLEFNDQAPCEANAAQLEAASKPEISTYVRTEDQERDQRSGRPVETVQTVENSRACTPARTDERD